MKAYLFNDDITLLENCELNNKAFVKLNKSDQNILVHSNFRRLPLIRPKFIPPVVEDSRCKLLGEKLKKLDLAAYLDPFALPKF